MSTTDKPADQVRGPFTVSFDWDDNWCSQGIETACADLPEDIKALYVGGKWEQDDDMVAHLLQQHYEAEYDNLDDDVRDKIETAVRDLSPHDGCCCASDAYDCWKGWVETTELAGLADQWAILTTHSEPEIVNDAWGDLTIDELFDATGHRDWTSVELKWNGHKLEAKFDSVVLDVVALTDEQEALSEKLAVAGADQPNCTTVLTDTKDLEVLMKIWEESVEPESQSLNGQYWVEDFLKALKGAGIALADPTAYRTFVAMVPDWDGPLEGLLAATVDLAAPVAA